MATNPTSNAPYVEGSPLSGLARLTFRIQAGANGAAPDFVLPAGAAQNIVYTSEGLYSLVIPNFLKYPVYIGGSVSLFGTSGTAGIVDGVVLHVVSYTASTGVLVFRAFSVANSPALADVLEDQWITFDLVFGQGSAADYAQGALAA